MEQCPAICRIYYLIMKDIQHLPQADKALKKLMPWYHPSITIFELTKSATAHNIIPCVKLLLPYVILHICISVYVIRRNKIAIIIVPFPYL